MSKFAFLWFPLFCVLCHGLNTQRNAIVLTVKASLWNTKRRSSELFNSVFLHVTLVLSYSKKTFLNRALWRQALADWVCVIVLIDWSTSVTILPVFYKHMLPKIWVLLQEGVSEVKCYTYHGNHVFYIMVTIISLLFLLFYPV